MRLPSISSLPSTAISRGLRSPSLSRALPLARGLSSAPSFATTQAPTRRPPRLRDSAAAPYHAPGERPAYPKRKSPYKRAGGLIDALHDEECARLVAAGRAVMPRKAPGLRAGDVVRVAYVARLRDERIQYFTGVCMAIKLRGLGSSFTLRNVVDSVAVERRWPLYSPLIKDAEVLERKRVVRNKLYYLREKPLKQSTFGPATRRPEVKQS